MSLYAVVKRNPYFKTSTYVRCFDEGCQKVKTRQEGNRMAIAGYEGIMIPFDTVRPFIMRVQVLGLDK